MPPHRVCRSGIARTFQNIRLFGNETVLENVMIGGHLRQKTGWWQAVLCLPGNRREERAIAERALELLTVVGLEALAAEKANSLPYGAQRRLEIARALATRTRLPAPGRARRRDEPATKPSSSWASSATSARGFDLTVLLIEHDMKVVMGICEHIWVLDYGETIADGPPEAHPVGPQGDQGLPRGGGGSRMLNVQDLHVYYGGIHALKGISIEVPKGKVVTLIGSNGAGKSSTLRAISGLIKNKKGTITFNGADLTEPRPGGRSSSPASSCRPRAGGSSRT